MSAYQKLIDWAFSWVGYLEKKDGNTKYLWDKTANAGSNNYTCFAYELAQTSILNGSKQGYPWCTTFFLDGLYQCFKDLGEDIIRKAIYIPKNSLAGGCYYAVQYYRAAGKFGSTPQLGAQIFFNDSSGEACHTGIVYGYDSSTVYTIEGNTSGASGVIDNGGGVCKKSYSRSYSRIAGYGYPDWSILEQTYTEGWVKDSKGWWYRYKDGSYPKSCWKKIDGNWYYFNGDGYAVANQWIVTDGNAYYLDGNCKMVSNKALKLDSSGKLVPAGAFYYKLGDVKSKEFRSVLDILVQKGALKGESGTGDDMVINLSEEAVRMFVIQHRLGLF